MDNNDKNTNINLLYPLSMYYVGAVEGVPNLEQQYQILAESREYSEKNKTRIDPYSIDEPVLALNLMMEKLEQYDYFEGVRDIANILLSQNRKPQELFRSLFPNSHEKVNTFKSQFSDACDLICLGEKVDWSRMGLSWSNFDIDLNKKNKIAYSSLKMDWTPDYWTKEEKDQLFNFWRERYSRIIINMSPSGKPAGGIGFFDSERHSLRFKTYRPTYSENHRVNLDFIKRRNDLLKEQQVSQPADKFRIELLLNAEYQGWEWWKIKNIYKVKEHDPLYFINKANEKVFYYESLYKEALAQLIEYDRENGFAIADPDRDFKVDAMTIIEYRNWLEREDRKIEPKSEDDILLENVWNEGPLGALIGKTPPTMKTSFIPSSIDEYHRNQQRSDRKRGIERSRSGIILKMNGVKKDDLIIERPEVQKNIKENGKDLKENILTFKKDIDDGRHDAEEIDLESVSKISSVKESSIVETSFENTEQEENISDPVIPEIFNIKQDLIPIPKNPYGEDLFEGLFTEKEFSEEDVVIETSESDETGSSGTGDVTPPWMIERNFDGSLGNKELNEQVKNENEKPIKEKLKKKRNEIKKSFDRNKEIQEITKQWKGLDEYKVEEAEGDIWSITQKRLLSFKKSAKNIWEDRVSYLLNVDIPEQKALLKIKTQELIAFKDKIMQKRVFGKKNKNIESEEQEIEQAEVVKPVSLYVNSYKPRK